MGWFMNIAYEWRNETSESMENYDIAYLEWKCCAFAAIRKFTECQLY